MELTVVNEMTTKVRDGHLIKLTQSNISKEDFDLLILKKLSVNIGDSFFIVYQGILKSFIYAFYYNGIYKRSHKLSIDFSHKNVR